MIIDKNDSIYENSYYKNRIENVYKHFNDLFYNEIDSGCDIKINVSLWKGKPQIEYFVEVTGSELYPGLCCKRNYSGIIKYSLPSKRKDNSYIGENMIIYALIKVGIKPKDIYHQYVFYDDSEFTKTNYKYDLYVKSLNTIIEHHGAQHGNENNYCRKYSNSIKDFKELQKRDLWKLQYCINHGVKYIQFSIYKDSFSPKYKNEYNGQPLLGSVNEVLVELGLRELTADELNNIIIKARKGCCQHISRQKLIIIWKEHRFVFDNQDEASDILQIHKQTLQRWRENSDDEFRIFYEWTTENVVIPQGDILNEIRLICKNRSNGIGYRQRFGQQCTIIFKDKSGELKKMLFSGYNELIKLIECGDIPSELKATKNVLKRSVMRNSSNVGIKYNLMSRYKNKALFIQTNVLNELLLSMSLDELFMLSGTNINKGKMPKVVCYNKNNSADIFVCNGATEMEKHMKSLGIKISSTSIENACFYENHYVNNTGSYRFCFLCEYEDCDVEKLMNMEDGEKCNKIKDVVLIINGVAVVRGGIREVARVFNISRSTIKKQLNQQGKLLKGIFDFEEYSHKVHRDVPLFSKLPRHKLDSILKKYKAADVR